MSRPNLGSTLLLLVGTCALTDHLQAQSAIVHSMNVRWHEDLIRNYTQGDLEESLEIATDHLITDSGIGDVACNVGFIVGTHASFPDSQGVLLIDSQMDFDFVEFSAPGYMRVISGISFCGGMMGNFSGCATENDEKGFVIVESELAFADEITGCLIAHEFGHSVGNDHTTGFNRIMRDQCDEDNVRISSAECSNWREQVDQNGCLTLEFFPFSAAPPSGPAIAATTPASV